MKVLVAIEDHIFGDAIAEFVAQHNWPANSEFKVIHVMEPIGIEQLSDISFLPFLEDATKENLRKAHALVRHIALQIREQFKSPLVSEEVILGKVKESLLNVAHNWPADLIIIGSHGKSAVSQFLLGSVSNAIISHANCSVVVIRLPHAAPNEESKSISKDMVLRS